MDEFDVSMGEAQKIIDRGRLKVNGEFLHVKGALIKGDIEVLEFVPKPRGIKPVYECEDFALFNKPSGVLVHPTNREDLYTLSDDIKYLFGKDANVVHRIDKETSGLVIVSKNKESEAKLKELFQKRGVKKEYLALVKGCLKEKMFIDAPLRVSAEDSIIKIKVFVSSDGKEAKTEIEPLRYDENSDTTLVKARPLTGRQHQIRVHLFHVKHPIVGDPIYILNEKDCDRYLGKRMSSEERLKKTGSRRLMLHAYRVEFEYEGKRYDIKGEDCEFCKF